MTILLAVAEVPRKPVQVKPGAVPEVSDNSSGEHKEMAVVLPQHQTWGSTPTLST